MVIMGVGQNLELQNPGPTAPGVLLCKSESSKASLVDLPGSQSMLFQVDGSTKDSWFLSSYPLQNVHSGPNGVLIRSLGVCTLHYLRSAGHAPTRFAYAPSILACSRPKHLSHAGRSPEQAAVPAWSSQVPQVDCAPRGHRERPSDRRSGARSVALRGPSRRSKVHAPRVPQSFCTYYCKYYRRRRPGERTASGARWTGAGAPSAPLIHRGRGRRA